MTADDGHKIISGLASPKKHRIILIPKTKKKKKRSTSINHICWHIYHTPNIFSLSWSSYGNHEGDLNWNLNSSFKVVKLDSWFLSLIYRTRYHYCFERCKGRKLSNKGTCKTLSSCKWSVYSPIDLVFFSLRNNECPIKFFKSPCWSVP